MALSVYDASSVLPPYTPSSIVPPYSPEPGQNERLIERMGRAKPRTFTGNYVKKFRRDTLVLTAQDEQADSPTYGRSALIEGFVSLEDRESVSEIVLKIKGNIEFMVSGGSTSKTILDEHYALWSSEHSDAQCPGSIPFCALLPARFKHNDGRYPLPPSYFASYTASGGLLYAKVFYALSITIIRSRRRKFSFLPSKNTMIIPFNYCPRTCATRPLPPPGSNFLADIKVMPEEWHQLTLTVSPRPKVKLPPVDLHLFTPALDVFALGEPIAVHVQLTGPVSALREFLPDPSVTGSRPRSCVEVTLVRQMRLHIHGSVEPTRATTGRAVLLPLPPSAFDSGSDDGRSTSLDWAGELRVDPEAAAVASFDAAVLQVQDFIVIDVFESGGGKSQYAHTRHSRPIRLVTDPWPAS
ncbi:hypothetical protein K438DRAFT_1722177 [Mycena galopus ATCC 62051]|nr:hypothetical protein K438DRAFT_1722177 [Mycena galopus ATCC 62051]